MPGFPDKFMPFMDEPPGSSLSASLAKVYGPMIRRLRSMTNRTLDQEPKWRHNKDRLTTGFQPRYPHF
jgi:hydrogenase small subunit